MGTIRFALLLAIVSLLVGIALGFSNVFLLEAIGTLLMGLGGVVLALALLLGVSFVVRGLLFDRRIERGRRFN